MAATMWWTAAVLAVMWVLGLAFQVGPIVHVLLALAVILVITNVLNERTHV